MSQALALLGGTALRKRAFPSWPVIGTNEEARLVRTLRGGKWGRLAAHEGERCDLDLAALHGARFCLGVVNGTVSLRLSLLAAGLPSGAEVIVPPYTFLATASAAIEANLVPVFADIELDTFNLSPTAVEAAITISW